LLGTAPYGRPRKETLMRRILVAAGVAILTLVAVTSPASARSLAARSLTVHNDPNDRRYVGLCRRERV
jgi:hypothetical protein